MSSDSTIKPCAPRTPPGIGHANDIDSLNAVFERQLNTLEQHLHDLQRQVQQLQRMASVGTLSAIHAHEFNNLLTPILTYTQYALTRDDPALHRTAVEKSNKNATRLAALCQRILGLSTGPTGGTTELHIKPLLVEALESIGRDFEKDKIAVGIDAPDHLKVRADAGAIQQVLFNLVINAWQAMLDKPGRLTLSARTTHCGFATIEVTDTGSGISPENLHRVFQPFFSTKFDEPKSYRRGTGLGLHVCRQLIEEQGGSIEVQSEIGKGTTFSIQLPSA
ncbi:MAG: HAMP domain-containing histidine kinase [Planctomycetes bacterium]|nr:HAMP domain-containing histidine kinase [Planctomycetota bacterium]